MKEQPATSAKGTMREEERGWDGRTTRDERDAEFIPDADMPFVADATGVPRLHLQC